MNAILGQSNEQTVEVDMPGPTELITELPDFELAYVGGGCFNASFI